MAEYSSRTSDNNDSARVNIVTAFFDFMAFFRFTGRPPIVVYRTNFRRPQSWLPLIAVRKP
jgi:hypothetical protein